ncbi:prevent-host-death protein [Rhodopseudomonas sp. P2A-2r]|uniref:prevent-host-death protein n=1 Tax=unclassified Rhodopseudomonas TaxID=2638247 RepID=UPI0022348611|nr:prevent-host-death protein [Rhodopseudomonas sp. P2A-2r]UZE49664.1 prevent-host-death protein [Rhodopseudomonas sp. P2A-2r]
MKHVSLSEAKADIGQVFAEVARGHAVTINPDPSVEAEADRIARTNRAIDGILELRKHVKPASIEEIIAWKNEGRE